MSDASAQLWSEIIVENLLISQYESGAVRLMRCARPDESWSVTLSLEQTRTFLQELERGHPYRGKLYLGTNDDGKHVLASPWRTGAMLKTNEAEILLFKYEIEELVSTVRDQSPFDLGL